jgi:hypothetical protein
VVWSRHGRTEAAAVASLATQRLVNLDYVTRKVKSCPNDNGLVTTSDVAAGQPRDHMHRLSGGRYNAN